MDNQPELSTSSEHSPITLVNTRVFLVRSKSAPYHSANYGKFSDLSKSDNEEPIVSPSNLLNQPTRQPEAVDALPSRPKSTPPASVEDSVPGPPPPQPTVIATTSEATATTTTSPEIPEASAVQSLKSQQDSQQPSPICNGKDVGDDSQNNSDSPLDRQDSSAVAGPSSSSSTSRYNVARTAPRDAELFDTYVARVLDVLPDVPVDLVAALILYHMPTSQENVVDTVISALSSKPTHSRPETEGKGKARQGSTPVSIPVSLPDNNGDREALPSATNDHSTSEELEDGGDGIECGCCFASFPVHKMVQCPDAHVFCQTCTTSYASGLLGAHDANIVCMDQSGCKLPFPDSQLRSILNGKLMDLYDRIKQTKEIEAAGLENLEACPFCDYKVVIENDDEKQLWCANQECNAVSCRFCKKLDHLPRSCKEAEEDNVLDGRHRIEEAMTRAVMRNCPQCQKAFIKQNGCNKIVCPNCRTTSCYVCRQIIHGYDHFDMNEPDEESFSEKCQLWDAVEERYDEEITTAAEQALAELRRENPDAARDDMGVDDLLALPSGMSSPAEYLPEGPYEPIDIFYPIPIGGLPLPQDLPPPFEEFYPPPMGVDDFHPFAIEYPRIYPRPIYLNDALPLVPDPFFAVQPPPLQPFPVNQPLQQNAGYHPLHGAPFALPGPPPPPNFLPAANTLNNIHQLPVHPDVLPHAHAPPRNGFQQPVQPQHRGPLPPPLLTNRVPPPPPLPPPDTPILVVPPPNSRPLPVAPVLHPQQRPPVLPRLSTLSQHLPQSPLQPAPPRPDMNPNFQPGHSINIRPNAPVPQPNLPSTSTTRHISLPQQLLPQPPLAQAQPAPRLDFQPGYFNHNAPVPQSNALNLPSTSTSRHNSLPQQPLPHPPLAQAQLAPRLDLCPNLQPGHSINNTPVPRPNTPNLPSTSTARHHSLLAQAQPAPRLDLGPNLQPGYSIPTTPNAPVPQSNAPNLPSTSSPRHIFLSQPDGNPSRALTLSVAPSTSFDSQPVQSITPLPHLPSRPPLILVLAQPVPDHPDHPAKEEPSATPKNENNALNSPQLSSDPSHLTGSNLGDDGDGVSSDHDVLPDDGERPASPQYGILDMPSRRTSGFGTANTR